MEVVAIGVALLALGVSIFALVRVDRIEQALSDVVLEIDDATNRAPVSATPDARFRTLGEP